MLRNSWHREREFRPGQRRRGRDIKPACPLARAGRGSPRDPLSGEGRSQKCLRTSRLLTGLRDRGDLLCSTQLCTAVRHGEAARGVLPRVPLVCQNKLLIGAFRGTRKSRSRPSLARGAQLQLHNPDSEAPASQNELTE